MRTSCAAVVIASMLLSAEIGRADVSPPPGDCANKQEGDACKDDGGREGACGSITYAATFRPPAQPSGGVPEVQQQQRTYFGCRAGVAPTKREGGGCALVARPEGGGSLALALGLLLALKRRRRATVATSARSIMGE